MSVCVQDSVRWFEERILSIMRCFLIQIQWKVQVQNVILHMNNI